MTTFGTFEKENNSLFLAVSLMIGVDSGLAKFWVLLGPRESEKRNRGLSTKKVNSSILESNTKEEEDMTDQTQLVIGKDNGAKYDSSPLFEKSFCHFYPCHLYARIVLL